MNTAKEHAAAAWRTPDPSPAALEGAITAYADEYAEALRKENDMLRNAVAQASENLHEINTVKLAVIDCQESASRISRSRVVLDNALKHTADHPDTARINTLERIYLQSEWNRIFIQMLDCKSLREAVDRNG